MTTVAPLTRLYLAGDVMLGRGIDQILKWPGDDRLHESYVRSALDYVHLAEQTSGKIPRAVDLSYVWGDAAEAIAAQGDGLVIINLETAITTHGAPEPKGINYRMTPRNAAGLKDLGVDCCVLANNHVLDWGIEGLRDTLETLDSLNIQQCGAGRNAHDAARPAILPTGQTRVLVFGFGAKDSGVPWHWKASADKPGIDVLDDYGSDQIAAVAAQVAAYKRQGDIVVASIHWGGNWGYDIAAQHTSFAHALIDQAGVDVIHGHSSHHPKGLEIHNGKLILYGCGDLINDYEGISGHDAYRGDLTAIYAVEVSATGRLVGLTVLPFQMRRFRLNRTTPDASDWLCRKLNQHIIATNLILAPGADHAFHLVERQD